MVAISAVVGLVALVGYVGYKVYDATEGKKERARAKIAEIDALINECNIIRQNHEALKKSLEEGISYLKSSREYFKNGGHVLDGVPLGDTKFTSCENQINAAIKNINDLVTDYNKKIEELKKERKKWEKDL